MTRILLAVLVASLAALGGATDVRCGKVRNAHLLAGLGIGALIWLMGLIAGEFSPASLCRWALNLALSAGFAIFFYRMDIWAPGDSKLFLAIAALYPPEFYPAPDGNLFPALDIIIFAFALGYLWIVIVSPVSEREKRPRISGISLRSAPSVAMGMGFAMGAQCALNRLFPAFFQANQALCILCIVGAAWLARRFGKYLFPILAAAGAIALIAEFGASPDWKAGAFILLRGALIAWIIEILNRRAEANSYRGIPGEALRPGMILSLGSVLAMSRCVDPVLPRATTESRRSRLSAAQAEAVRRWCKNAGRDVVIVEMIPFAPFIAASVLVTLMRYAAFYR